MTRVNLLQIISRIVEFCYLTFTTLLAHSTDNKFMIIILFFLENRILHFMQIVCTGDGLHEMLRPDFSLRKIFQYVVC